MTREQKNIFVIGLDPFNHALLEKTRSGPSERFVFHNLLDYVSVAEDPHCDVNALLERAWRELEAFDGSIDAIVGYWDFPTILMLPILRERYGLPGPELHSVLKCEHKYWARLLEQEVTPGAVPAFALVDPLTEGTENDPPLAYPFWIKPVKAHSSMLGFKVRNAADYHHAITAMRQNLYQFAPTLDAIMAHTDIPEEVKPATGWTCIAEEIISHGYQCTLEGYVFEGRVKVYGIIDSVRAPNRISFQRYQYPSTLPSRVKKRMGEICRRVFGKTGLESSPFNMEFFWDSRTDIIWILEINARISKSHSLMFEMVEGTPHKQVMIDMALGRETAFPFGEGQYRHAAKFMLRRYDLQGGDRVHKVPTQTDIERIEADVPGCTIRLHVHEGMRMKELPFQDSYSFELADIFIGANSQGAMMQKYRDILERLDIHIGGDN